MDGETADSAPWGRLLRRPEFQRVSRGRRVNAAALTLQVARAPEDVTDGPRYGLTVTKKTGSSPERHRIKRRLREAMRLTPRRDARPDHDYVLMARREALTLAFDALVADIAGAIQRAHAARPPRDRQS